MVKIEALPDLSEESIDENAANEIIAIYDSSKDMYVRNLCIKLLYRKTFASLETFFERAFKRERYLDMKIHCIRGLSQFWTEAKLKPLLKKIDDSLIKRAKTTPYNYQEYELLLGKNALPFLISKYGYESFKKTYSLVKSNYDAMPEAFKGHFSVGDDGKLIQLKTPEESKKCFDDFFKHNEQK